MTAYRFCTLTCDGCGEIWDDGRSRTTGDARQSARAAGWRRHSTVDDLCGVCNGTHERTARGVFKRADALAATYTETEAKP